MARHDSQLELSIDLGNDDSDTALLQLISSLSLEAVVDQTLHEAGVLQPSDAHVADHQRRNHP